MIVAAFDIGIKNLAFCIFDTSANAIIGWENVNLLGASGGERHGCQSKRGACNSNASWSVRCAAGAATEEYYCRRHIPASHTVLCDISGQVIKKLPTLADIKDILATSGTSTTSCKKKDDYVARLAEKYALPIEIKKEPRATHVALEDIHDAIRKMISARASLFNQCQHILLENQPVFKNPTMKSVQIILFTTLRDYYYTTNQPQPICHFVHAGKKVQGATKGDAGYAERKGGSEARVAKWLEEHSTNMRTIFTSASKKSDLADALCMCLDFGTNKTK
jgi:hypothetical protein